MRDLWDMLEDWCGESPDLLGTGLLVFGVVFLSKLVCGS